MACVVATAFLSRRSVGRTRIIAAFSFSSLCCDPTVGGGASREHRGANEALGMPAGGEEPGAAKGESLVEAARQAALITRRPLLHEHDSSRRRRRQLMTHCLMKLDPVSHTDRKILTNIYVMYDSF